jgi:hypothetical protein
MWRNKQNLGRPGIDNSGKRWNFRVWSDVLTIGLPVRVARIFFWDDRRESTGVVLLGPDVSQHVRDLHGVIQKLVASNDLRARHQRELRFPLERHYAEYGAFPEESELLSRLESSVYPKGPVRVFVR